MTRVVAAVVLATAVFVARPRAAEPPFDSADRGVAQGEPPAALTAMVDAERAFAKRASEVGVRDSFLEFFADDSIRFAEAPGPAKAFFRGMTPQPPAVVELTWTPRVGDVAASGELGYLTGPATRIVHRDPAPPPASLCYFSIWKRQADGTFKVFIDQGISTPEPVDVPAGFTRAAAADRYTGKSDDARRTLERADRTFMADAARRSLAEVYSRAFASDGRLYRDGVMPMVGANAERWLAAAPDRRMTGESLSAEATRSAHPAFTTAP